MQIAGSARIAAAPDAVWAALIDPAFLSRLIPGCERMSGSVEEGYAVTAARSVAGAEIRMTGRFALSEVQPGRGCLLTGSGEAAGAGGAHGTCRIALAPDGAGTRLSWDISAGTEGRLAKLPDFVVSMAARKVADGFVARFAAALEGREPAARTGLLGRLRG